MKTFQPGQARRWIVSRSFPETVIMPLIAGALTVAAMPPWSLWFMLWPGFSLFYMSLCLCRSTGSAFRVGWMFGFGFFLLGLSWIAKALTVEGSTYTWVIPFAIAGLPILLSIFTGAAAWIAFRYMHLRSISGFLGFVAILSLCEWLRGHVFSGFPWNLFGYGWAGSPAMSQIASLFGIYGLSFLTILWAALPGYLLASRLTRKTMAIFAGCCYAGLLGLLIFGHARLNGHPTESITGIRLRIVQPSVPQTYKWDSAKQAESFDRLMRASSPGAGAIHPDATTIMIWPETAISQDIVQNPVAKDLMRDVFASYRGKLFLVAGVLRWDVSEDRSKLYNSIGVYDSSLNLIGTYDKTHLVPFGEYIPLSRWLPANPLVAGEGFETGNGATLLGIPVTDDDAFLISPMICYEVIFPGAVVNTRMHRPGLLLNVTNDGWYGDSAGPRQHLAIARFRAIEEGIPLARAANTGISAAFDAYGRILWSGSIFAQTASDIALPRTTPHRTMYAVLGDGPFLWLCLILAGWATWRSLAKRR